MRRRQDPTRTGVLIIFDCDGVLVDTETINQQALITVLHRTGIDVTEVEAKQFLGLSNRGVVDKVEALWGMPLGDRFVPELEAVESELVRRYVQPVEGIRCAVMRISGSGFATCVASNGSLEAVRERLMHARLLDLFVDRLFSAEQVIDGKPSPDLFLHAAAAMGHSPASCIVVEDSLPGVVAGRAAGMRVFVFAPPSRRSTASALEAAGGVVFSAMNKLPHLLSE